MSELGAVWFRPVAYIGEDNTERPSFDLTRDGFTLLVMGWTGERAMTGHCQRSKLPVSIRLM
jgi:Rha family phage regulatory protein